MKNISEINKIKARENEHIENEVIAAMEGSRINNIIKNEVCHDKCGCVVQISKIDILESASYKRMKGDWIYRINSNEEDVCLVIGSVAYQINWYIVFLPTGNSFLSFIAPVFKRFFDVLKFSEDEKDINNDVKI